MNFGPVNTAAMFVMSMAAAYFFLAVAFGFRQLRRHDTAPGFQADLRYGHPFVPLAGAPTIRKRPHLYTLIPCLNEASVIGRTVAALVAPAGWSSRIVVIDDGSDDGTGTVAKKAGRGQVHVVRRRLPEARQGKGAALNAGFAYVAADVARRGLDPDRVVVVVMDADGRLSDGALHEVLPLFDDPAVGGVQLAVRIRNRATNFLVQFQDHQFWTLSALTQFGRISTATVSLGGNGQFARLSALLEIGAAPWTVSLTEDLDLSISLAVRGWQLTSTPRAAVDQQGVEALRPLIRQRTRWYQGHMMAGARLAEVLRAPRISNAAAIEMVLYLAVPWLFDLPWSVLYHLILAEIGLDASDAGLFGGTDFQVGLEVALWYLLCFWPALVTAVLARRRDPAHSWARAIKLGHCFVATNYLSYVCAWRALYRIVRRRNGWAKTARNAEHEVLPVRQHVVQRRRPIRRALPLPKRTVPMRPARAPRPSVPPSTRPIQPSGPAGPRAPAAHAATAPAIGLTAHGGTGPGSGGLRPAPGQEPAASGRPSQKGNDNAQNRTGAAVAHRARYRRDRPGRNAGPQRPRPRRRPEPRPGRRLRHAERPVRHRHLLRRDGHGELPGREPDLRVVDGDVRLGRRVRQLVRRATGW